MKKILIFVLFISILSSCYDDFRLDNEFSSVAFSSATGGSNESGVLWRTVVKGEGLKVDAGVYLAGILDNDHERWANYEIDPSLLNGTTYTLMPNDYYTLSDNKRFVIPAGETIGRITILLDSIKFLNDDMSIRTNYALPFRLTETSEDSILSTQNTQILVLKYMNKYEGNYNHKGTFETIGAEGESLNVGNIENVIQAKSVFLDTTETNGVTNLLGPNFKMKFKVNDDNTVFLAYSPNLNVDNTPKNLALEATVSSSYVAPWNNENAVKSGVDPASSAFDGQINSWANYGSPSGDGGENWLQYDFGGNVAITKSDVYWAADGGGVQIPNNSYLEYWDLEGEEWKLLDNNNIVNDVSISEGDYGVVNAGNDPDKYNVTTFDKITTDKLRVYATSPTFTGIHEWKVWGVPAPAGLESAPIESIVENGDNAYDPSTSKLTLNYTVNYIGEEYKTNVSATLVWRNRIRDGVNEWRR